MRYAIVIEKAGHNYAAYAPDVPGCGATAVVGRRTATGGMNAAELRYDGRRFALLLLTHAEPVVQPLRHIAAQVSLATEVEQDRGVDLLQRECGKQFCDLLRSSFAVQILVENRLNPYPVPPETSRSSSSVAFDG